MTAFERIQDLVAEARSMGQQYETGLSEQRVVKASGVYWIGVGAFILTLSTAAILEVKGNFGHPLAWLFVALIIVASVLFEAAKRQEAIREGSRESLEIFGWSESVESCRRRADAASSVRLAQGRIVWLAEMIEVQITRAFDSEDHQVVIPQYEPGQSLFMGLEKTEVLAWIEPLGDPQRANPLVKVIRPSGEREIKELTINQERELVLITPAKIDRSWKPC